MKDAYPPREFAEMVGRSVQTLQRWDRLGILKAFRTPSDRRFYTHDQYLAVLGKPPAIKKTIVYSRVSSSNQRQDLQSQKKALEQFCIASGRVVDQYLEDIGSGLNYERKQFCHIMSMVERGEVGAIIIAHKDRLVRFGFEWFEKFCLEHGAEIVVMNAPSLSPEEEMTQDLLSIVHCFSSRLYGLRKYKKRIATLITTNENSPSAD